LAEWVELAVLAGLAEWVALAALAGLVELVAWVASAELAESVAWVERAESADPEVPAESAVPVAPEVPVSPAPAVPRVRAERVAGTPHGITTPSIAAARPMETARRRTVSVAARAAHPPLRAKRAHANRSAIRAEILQVTVAAAAVPA
jgi:hypothetical protein